MSGHRVEVGAASGVGTMPTVVGVHGIGQQFKGPNVLRTEWLPALRDGLCLAGVKFPQDDDLVSDFAYQTYSKLSITS